MPAIYVLEFFSMLSFKSNDVLFVAGSFRLNIWDVGGQKTLRSYWRNYYEQTDGLVWVVDSSDLRRLDDCKAELHNLLKEERLSGASLLVLANKQDIRGALKPADIAKVAFILITRLLKVLLGC